MLMFEVLQPLAPELFWILCVAFVIAFLLAFSVGANDVSNSFGTSVGSRVLTVTQACILATIFELAGATLLGYSVCDTFRKKMYDVRQYDGAQKELMLGALACLIGSSVWNLIATALKMPISGTHSIVGATIGFSLVSRGWASIRWLDMARIVASWFASPLLSGAISSLIYVLISKTIICKIDPLRHGLKALPLFYGATIFINVASIVIDGPAVMGLDQLPWYAGLFIALTVAALCICCVALILVPRLKSQIAAELLAQRSGFQSLKSPHKLQVAYDNATFKSDGDTMQQDRKQPPVKPKREFIPLDATQLDAGQQRQQEHAKIDTAKPQIAPKPAHLSSRPASKQEQLDEIDLESAISPSSLRHHSGGPVFTETGERYEVAKLFGSLQILTACFASFAHGTNDVSNAVAPLIPIWNIYTTGQEDVGQQTQVWILAFGSIGICTGLWAWGRAVMSTISDGLTRITPSKGFAIELGAAISVLCATKLGLPISTTHCKVGSLVIVGLVSSKFLSQDNLMGKMSLASNKNNNQLQILDSMPGEGKQDIQIQESDEDSVDWKMFGNIALTWVSTVPLAALASAVVMYLLRWFAL